MISEIRIAIIKAMANLFPFIPHDILSALNIKIIFQIITGIEIIVTKINDTD